jgi:hypothetical protein
MDLICVEFHRLGIRQPARTFPNGGGEGEGGGVRGGEGEGGTYF